MAAIVNFLHRPKVRRRLIAATLLFACYLLLGFLVLPAVIKWQLLKRLPAATHRTAAVRQVRVNPLTLSLTVRGLSLSETNGQPFASFEEFYANFQLSSLFRFAWTFDEILLRDPRVEVILDQQKQPNFANLFQANDKTPSPPPQQNPSLPRVLVFDLTVTNGHAGFADLSRKTPFRTTYAPINLHVARLTTRPGAESPYAFEASGDSGKGVAWTGTLTAQPLGSSGSLRLIGIDLPKHSPYLEGVTRAVLSDGTLDLSANYAFAVSTNGTDLAVSNLVVKVAQVRLKDPGTGEVVVGLPALHLANGDLDLRTRRVHASSLTVEEPAVLLRRRQDGSLNSASLLVPPATPAASESTTNSLPEPAPAEPSWTVALDDYQLRGGSVQFEDLTVPGAFRSLLSAITVRIQHFSTATNREAEVEAGLTTDANETVAITGGFTPNSAAVRATVKLSSLQLKRYQPYLEPFFTGRVFSGMADATLDFIHEGKGESQKTEFTNAAVRLSALEIGAPDGQTIPIRVPAFSIESVSGSLADKQVLVAQIRSSGARILAQRKQNGALDLLRLIRNRAPTTTTAVATTNSEPWQFKLSELTLSDWAVHLTDRTLRNPGQLALDDVALTLRDVQFPGETPLTAELASRVNGSGTITVNAKVSPRSGAVDGEISLDGLELQKLQPWIEQQARLGVERGSVRVKGRVEVAQPGSTNAPLHFTGTLGVRDLATVDQVLFKEFVRWDDLELRGIDLALQPVNATVDQATLSGLRTSLILDPQKRLNVLAVLPKPPERPPEPVTDSSRPVAADVASVATAPPVLQLGELRLEKASLAFQDQSVQPPCAFELKQLDGIIQGVSTRPGSTAEISLEGHVDEAAPFALHGHVKPSAQELALQLAFTNHNLQLTPFTPYMEKYAGYPLNKGRLSLDLNYALEAKSLKAQNKVQIDQLILGAKNNNPDASQLPIKLAVALLKDNNGRIDLDLPVEGRLDDPQFSVGPVIVKVIVNLIVKAAASPFKILGALVGGGEELSFVDFQPGTTRLLDSETNKLEKLVEALQKRPALSLEIEGSLDPAADRDSLARDLVRNQVRVQRLQELAAIGQAPPSAEQLTVQPTDNDRILRALVLQSGGTNLAERLRAAAERAAAATNLPSGPPRVARGPGLLVRLGSLFKPKMERAATRQAYQAAKADALLLEKNPELGRLTAEQMEVLLAAETQVPPEMLQQLMQGRAKAVQNYLLDSGKVNAERLFLVAPKTPDSSFQGDARAHLALQ